MRKLSHFCHKLHQGQNFFSIDFIFQILSKFCGSPELAPKCSRYMLAFSAKHLPQEQYRKVQKQTENLQMTELGRCCALCSFEYLALGSFVDYVSEFQLVFDQVSKYPCYRWLSFYQSNLEVLLTLAMPKTLVFEEIKLMIINIDESSPPTLIPILDCKYLQSYCYMNLSNL